MSDNKSIETPRRVIRERGTSTCQNRVLIITSISGLLIIGVAVILLWRVAALHSEVTIMYADLQLMCAHVSKLDHSRDENNGAPVTSETETERSGYVHSLTALDQWQSLRVQNLRVPRSADTSTPKPEGRRKGKKNKDRHPKRRAKKGRRGKKGEKGEKGDVGPRGERGEPGSPGAPCVVSASHYVTNFSSFWTSNGNQFGGNDLRNKHDGVITDTTGLQRCIYYKEWDGEVCRNRTFRSSISNSKQTLKFLRSASWMSEIESPLESLPTGRFRAKKTGLYMLYCHVVFYGSNLKQSIAIVHEPENKALRNVFRCMESIDYVKPDSSSNFNSRYKSCSVTGLLYIKENETVEVQNLYANIQIDLSDDATYFGAVLLNTPR